MVSHEPGDREVGTGINPVHTGDQVLLAEGGNDAVEVKNRVQFGPIIAGVLTAIATLLILTVLGLAVGSTALEPRDVGQSVGTAAAVWGIVSALIAFFLGGWVAAKTAAVAGAGSGMINGLMVGAALLVVVLWLASTGIGAVVGAVGGSVGDIASVVQDEVGSVDDAQTQVEEEVDAIDPKSAFDAAKDGAWGTLAGLILPLVAAGAGGLVGHNERRDVIQPGRPSHA